MAGFFWARIGASVKDAITSPLVPEKIKNVNILYFSHLNEKNRELGEPLCVILRAWHKRA
jgi:hypothetical protein